MNFAEIKNELGFENEPDVCQLLLKRKPGLSKVGEE